MGANTTSGRHQNGKAMYLRNYIVAVAVALVARASLPALAVSTLDVPIVAGAPAEFSKAAVAEIGWDPQNNGPADEAATAHVYGDGTTIFVRFDVPQREVLEGSEGGDCVAIDLWPKGASGEYYRLGVNLDGSHTDDSTANTVNWGVAKSTHVGGYSVTISIPMSVVTTTSTPVLVQFSRWIAFTAEEQIWSHNSANASLEDIAQAGTMILESPLGFTKTLPGGKGK
jgi:hypothetical protein